MKRLGGFFISQRLVILVFVLAILLRLLLVFNAYHGDLNNNISWGTLAVERGLNGFYGNFTTPDTREYWPYSAPNQPPLTILMFAGLRLIWLGLEKSFWYLNNSVQLFPSKIIWFWEAKGMILLIKLPSIIADLIIGLVIYKYIITLKKGKNTALILTSIWLFNPITWYNSSIWGQTDSIVNLLGLLAIIALLRKDLERFSVWLTLSFLFKASLGLFIPVLGYYAFKQSYKLKRWIKSLIYATLFVFLVTFWFHPHSNVAVWLYSLYKYRILPGEIWYLTSGGFNFWWLLNHGNVLDSTTYLGLTARIWGIVLTLLISIFVIIKITDNKFKTVILWKGLTIVSVASFLFMTRIHGRYLYPFFIPATILLADFNLTFLLIYVAFSLTFLLNMYNNFWYPSIPILEMILKNSNLSNILSFLNIGFFLILLRQFTRTRI